MRPNATTRFDHLLKTAFKALYPAGSATRRLIAPAGSDGYSRAVKPDFVLPDGRWIDFKFHVSFRESRDVAWRPSALYSSLRKYVDHPDNRHRTLSIVYGHVHGSIGEVDFPVKRGPKILIADAHEFQKRIVFVDAERLYGRIRKTPASWVVDELQQL